MSISTQLPGLATNNTLIGRGSWNSINNVLAIDNQYAQFTNNSLLSGNTIGIPSNLLVVTDFGHNIPSDAVVRGIEVSMGRLRTAGNSAEQNDFAAFIVKNNTIQGIVDSTSVTDTFTDVEGIALNHHIPNIGGPWVILSGTWLIHNNTLLHDSNATVDSVYINGNDSNFHLTVSLVMGVTSSGGISYSEAGVRFRATPDGANYWEFILSSNNQVFVRYCVNNVVTVAQTFNVTIVQGFPYNIVIDAMGDNIQMEIVGVLTAYETSISANSTLTNVGLVGALVGNIIAGNQYEDLIVVGYDEIVSDGSNKAIIGAWSTSYTTVVYGNEVDGWGTSWLPSDINNSGFGFAFSVVSDDQISQIDYITTSVIYNTTDNISEVVHRTVTMNSHIGNSLQRIGIMDDNPQHAIWIVDYDASNNLQLTTLFGVDAGNNIVNPSSVPTGWPTTINTQTITVPLSNVASHACIAAGSGIVAVIYTKTLGSGLQSIVLRTIPSSDFSTLTIGDISSEVTIETATSNSQIFTSSAADMGPDGVGHVVYISTNLIALNGAASIRYINTHFLTLETVYTVQTGATLNEVSVVIGSDNIVNITLTLSIGSSSNIVYARKDWASFPTGGWSGGVVKGNISNMSGLSVVLDNTNVYHVFYLAGNPTQVNYLTADVTTLTISLQVLALARGTAATSVTAAIDQDNNPHVAWTEAGITDRFFHADPTSIFADQIIIDYVGNQIGAPDAQSVDTVPVIQIAYYGAPATNIFGKYTYPGILGNSPRYLAAVLNPSGATRTAYATSSLSSSAYLSKGGTLVGTTATPHFIFNNIGIGGVVANGINSIGNIYTEIIGGGGVVTGGLSLNGLGHGEFLSGGGLVSGTPISNFWGYISTGAIITISGSASLFVSGLPPLGVIRSFNLSDLSFVYSGGTLNNNPDLSLGGPPSLYPIVGVFDNLFTDVTPTEATSGLVDYRAFYIFNDHPTESIYNVGIWIVEETTGGSSTLVGVAGQDELQNINISQNISNGSFSIQYEPSNLNAFPPVNVAFSSDLATWATNLQNALNSIPGVNNGVHVIAAALQVGVSFDILFEGLAGQRSQELLAITKNNLTPSAAITVTRKITGGPVNVDTIQIPAATTLPSGVNFVNASQLSPVVIPLLNPTEGFAVWLQRTVIAGAPAIANDGLVLRISVEPLV